MPEIWVCAWARNRGIQQQARRAGSQSVELRYRGIDVCPREVWTVCSFGCGIDYSHDPVLNNYQGGRDFIYIWKDEGVSEKCPMQFDAGMIQLHNIPDRFLIE